MRPIKLNYITCRYGKPGSWSAGYHTGIDYRAPVGTPAHSTKDGRVIHAGWGGWGSAYGLHVIVESSIEGRTIRHLYAHLSKPLVKEGEHVRVGEKVGLTGVSGNVTGPHLHYEERVSPFGYWQHIRPRLIHWRPPTDQWLADSFRRIGLYDAYRKVLRRIKK